MPEGEARQLSVRREVPPYTLIRGRMVATTVMPTGLEFEIVAADADDAMAQLTSLGDRLEQYGEYVGEKLARKVAAPAAK